MRDLFHGEAQYGDRSLENGPDINKAAQIGSFAISRADAWSPVRTTVFLTVLLYTLLLSAAAAAQTPFVTDDADVTETGKVHLEFLNEYDVLQRSAEPSLRQNTTLVSVTVGVHKNVEVGVEVPAIIIFNTADTFPRRPLGLSDVGANVKVKLKSEKQGSVLPALGFVFAVRFPTGNTARDLGSGVANYQVYGIAEKSLTKKIKLRGNAGLFLAGNTAEGALGVRTTNNGRLFTGGVSITKQYSERLLLGAELTGVANGSLELSEGQLQTMFGGNYQLTKKLALDAGVVIGRFPASPRFGFLLGFSYDF
jgi:hypothetical protein